jgi:hypothetical protein
MVDRPSKTAMRTVAVVAIAALMVTAGCVGSLGGDGNGNGTQDGTATVADQRAPAASAVPARAQMIASYDTGMITDPTTQAVANAYLRQVIPEDSEQPRTVEGYLEEARGVASAQSNLSLAAVSGATMFVEYPEMESMMGAGATRQPTPYVGVLVESAWSEDDVVSLLERSASAEVDEETYKGTTLYTSTSSETTVAFGKYGENRWVLGTIAAAKDAIDVAEGDAEPVSGQLKTAYEGTADDGYVRFAATVPQQYRRVMNSPMADRASMGGVSPSSFSNVTAVAGSYYTEGGQDGTVGTNLVMTFDGGEPADSVKRQIDGGLALLQDNVENETVKTQLDAIDVTRDGRTVTIQYESSVGEIRTAIEQFASVPTMGVAGATMATGSSSQVPRAGFAFDYEPDSNRVTATLTSADSSFDPSSVVARCGGTTIDVPDDLSVGGTVTTSKCSPGDTLRVVHRGPASTHVLAQFEVPSGASVAVAG